ncbi:hypothetical protein [Helicobacter pylori]|uniref:hypothetical protein n=1 Tax=Helicobacter pylori TaxID=210 RepID=UPI00042E3A63|nr:hypothetical protein [Helicobacter pylori]AHN38567.1 hypothetical protein HPOKI154_01010 [Helicobacter pylori oki154]AHN42908.1 hypothetical protein HPOKI828_01010 [Helicobacter pylori oki828]
MRLNSVLKSIHSLKTFVCCLKTMGAFKSYEIIVCCLITPLTLQEESGLKLALYGCDGGARSKRASALTLL